MLFSLVAEQNVDLMEEVQTLTNTMKEVLEQFANDVEDHLNDIKEDVKKQNVGTANALSILTREAIKLQESTTNQPQSTSVSSSSPPCASSKPKVANKSTPSAPEASSLTPKDTMPSKQTNHKKRRTIYQQKPKVLLVGDSLAHNSNFNKLEVVKNTTIKTAKGYSSVWDKNARYKHLNITDVTRNELENGQYDHLVLAAPTVDITNLATINNKPGDDADVMKEKVRASCLNMLNVAEKALADHHTLKKVTLMNHAPRYDTANKDPMGMKHNLANFANSYLLELWLTSPHKDRIFIGQHKLDVSADTRMFRQTDEHSGKYDGVHYYGSAGSMAYTESVLNILISVFNDPSLAGSKRQSKQSNDEDNHTRCPQANYKRKFSSVVMGQPPLKTKNRFSPLNGISGN